MTLVRVGEVGAGQTITLSEEQADRLSAAGIVKMRRGRGDGTWIVQADTKVGSVRVGDIELLIEPKVPVERLLFLVGYARHPRGWRDETVALPTHAGLIPAMAAGLWRQTERALRQGLLQGYRTVEETSAVLRGRVRETDQLSRQLGLPMPLEIRHDDYTVDIVENRILATAAERMLRVPGVDAESRRMLRHLANRFIGVTRLRKGTRAPDWTPSRLNSRYHIALRLAELVLEFSSVDAGIGPVASNGFLVNMPTVFEDFVFGAFRDRVESRYGGVAYPQERSHLDERGRIALRPDVVWRHGGRALAVVDAKYKTRSHSSDTYQMLAYCTVFGLDQGHLVYVSGDHPAMRHAIRNTGIEIVCHALDLSLPPAALLGQIADIADQVAASAAIPGR